MDSGHAASDGMTCGLARFLLVAALLLAFVAVACLGLVPGTNPEVVSDTGDDAGGAPDEFAFRARWSSAILHVGVPFALIPGRVRRERLLDHRLRKRILEEVERHPGIHHRQLLRTLGVSNGTLAYHLRQLERAGYLRFSRAHGRKLLWVPKDGVDEELVRMTDRDRELLMLLAGVPDARMDELGARCGLKASGVGYHLNRLRALGLVRTRREGHALVFSRASLDGGTPKVCTTKNAPA